MSRNAGIYAIHNTVNDRLYIGSAVSMRRRFNKHRQDLRRGIHHSSRLQRAWNKYGAEAFGWLCLEAVSGKEKLIEREQAWLTFFRSWHPEWGYNICRTAGSMLGMKFPAMSARKKGRPLPAATHAAARAANVGKPLSAECRAALSAVNTGQKRTAETRAAMSAWQTGRTLPPEHRANLSLAQKKVWAEKPRTHTAETKEKLRLLAKEQPRFSGKFSRRPQ